MTNRLLLLSLLILSQNSLATSAPEVISPAEEVINRAQVKPAKRRLSIKAMSKGVAKALDALKNDPFSEESVWDQNYLKREQEVSTALKKYMAGEYAVKLKNLNFNGLNKDQIITLLNKEGFERKEPEGRMDDLLGRGKDREYQDSGEIFIASDGSMIKIKDHSAKRYHRPQAYIIKAALKNPKGPITWQNEAFKVTKEGFPVPKGPKQNQGLKIHAPNSSGQDEDKGWIDLIMEEIHTDIEPKK